MTLDDRIKQVNKARELYEVTLEKMLPFIDQEEHTRTKLEMYVNSIDLIKEDIGRWIHVYNNMTQIMYGQEWRLKQ